MDSKKLAAGAGSGSKVGQSATTLSNSGSIRNRSKSKDGKESKSKVNNNNNNKVKSSKTGDVRTNINKSITVDGGTGDVANGKDVVDNNPKKIIYKAVLGNPLLVQWPNLSNSSRIQIFEELLKILQTKSNLVSNNESTFNKNNLDDIEKVGAEEAGKDEDDKMITIQEWREDEHRVRRSKKTSSHKKKKNDGGSEGIGQKRVRVDAADGRSNKKRKLDQTGSDASTVKERDAIKLGSHLIDSSSACVSNSSSEEEPISTSTPLSTKTHSSQPKPELKPSVRTHPKLLDSFIIGINDLTNNLETMLRWGRFELGELKKSSPGFLRLKIPPPPQSSTSSIPLQERISDLMEDVENDKQQKEVKGQGKTELKKEKEEKKKLRRKNRLKSGDLDDYFEQVPILKDYLTKEEEEQVMKSDYKFLLEDQWNGGEEMEKEKETEGKPWLLDDGKRILVNSSSIKLPTKGKDLEEGSSSKGTTSYPLIDLVFVCRPDINPPSLVDHLPSMIASFNGIQEAIKEPHLRRSIKEGKGKEEEKGSSTSTTSSELRKIYLVQLDKGAELKLANALGLRRVSAIGICSFSSPIFSKLHSMISSTLTPLEVPWLNPTPYHPNSKPTSSNSNSTSNKQKKSEQSSTLIPTHIKHVKTTQPLNPRISHLEKKKLRKQKKEDRKFEISKMERKERRRKKKEEEAKEKEKGKSEGGGLLLDMEIDENAE